MSDPEIDSDRDSIVPSYPIQLNLRGRIAVVVGLGPVGRRKVLGLLEAGALVRGIDPLESSCTGVTGVDLWVESYRSSHLDGATLAIAAASPPVNATVVRDAQRLGILVASASAPSAGDFIVPACWRDGPITLTVATDGASPALAATLRDRAAAAIGPEAAALATLLFKIRAAVRSRIDDPSARRRALQAAADPAWLDHLAQHGRESTWLALRRAFGLD